jgi:SAM-dependent methyltransferase
MDSADELELYDTVRGNLQRRLEKEFSRSFNLENTISAYAYWICTSSQNRSRDLSSVMEEYVEYAIRDAEWESKSEQIELESVRDELQKIPGPLLDVGAGWGRYACLYDELGIEVVYVEPSVLGCQLMRRNHLFHSLRCLGQQLCFASGSFNSVVIAWVLHHDASDMPANRVLQEVARVTRCGGFLLSIEPLSINFDERKWRVLQKEAGFEVQRTKQFFKTTSKGIEEHYTIASALRLSN